MSLCDTKSAASPEPEYFGAMRFRTWMQKALQGDALLLAESVKNLRAATAVRLLIVILAGSALYGSAVGAWRSPLQGGYTAIKIPLLLLVTCGSNGLLNALFAKLLGANLSFRQTLAAIGMSFAIAATILAAFSPLAWLLVWNVPPLEDGNAGVTHSVVLLFHVAVIAYAGILANIRLQGLLRQFCLTRAASTRVLFSWLAGNLLMGSQLAWVLRPFIGSPNLTVEFFRSDAFQGSFFESVFRALLQIFT